MKKDRWYWHLVTLMILNNSFQNTSIDFWPEQWFINFWHRITMDCKFVYKCKLPPGWTKDRWHWSLETSRELPANFKYRLFLWEFFFQGGMDAGQTTGKWAYVHTPKPYVEISMKIWIHFVSSYILSFFSSQAMLEFSMHINSPSRSING